MGGGLTIAAFVAVACTNTDTGPSSRVFAAPAWTGPESTTYNLVQQGGDVYGTCTLETRPGVEPNRTELRRLCSNGPYRDDGIAVVDSASLQPFSSTRTVVEPGKQRVHASTYAEGTVHMKTDVNGKVNEIDRNLPKPGAKIPDPGWYDDESLLWLVRGIPLRQGFEGAYYNVAAPIGQVFRVQVAVTGQEKVKVPAGEYTAWKVRIKTASITQLLWVDTQAPHRVVRARIERLTYEMTAAN